MTLPRLYIDAPCQKNVNLFLNENQRHYLTKVLRLKPKDSVLVFNGQDGEWRTSLMENSQTLHCEEQVRNQTPIADITLFFAPVKRAGTHIILEKATELGVTTLHPIQTERTQTTRLNLHRWKAIVTEAAEQTERLSIPDIKPFIKLKTCLENWPKEYGLLVCDEHKRFEMRHILEKQNTPHPIPQIETNISPLTTLSLFKNQQYTKTALLTGPEGGFTPFERKLLAQKEFVFPLVLGPGTLRAETAVISALTLVQTVLGNWSSTRIQTKANAL